MAKLTPADSCFTCPKADEFDWCQHSLNGLAVFDNNKSTKAYPRKEAVFHEGDPCNGLYCVQSGEIAIGKSDRDGNMVILRIADRHSTLGLPCFFAEREHTTTAIALTPSRVCFVPRPAVETLIARNPKLAYSFFKHVVAELDEMEHLYLANATTTVRQRLIHLLDSVKDRYATGAKPNLGVVLKLPLSRCELAAMVATRPETISRTIHQLRSEGIADFREKVVMIPDIARLSVEARRAGAA